MVENKILKAIGSGVSSIYQWFKRRFASGKNYLVKHYPFAKKHIRNFFSLLRRLLKGLLFGFYYGSKDGYHSWKQYTEKELPEEYYFLTTIEFDKED